MYLIDTNSEIDIRINDVLIERGHAKHNWVCNCYVIQGCRVCKEIIIALTRENSQGSFPTLIAAVGIIIKGLRQ